MMEALRSFETLVLTTATWHNTSEDGILHSYRCETLISYRIPVVHFLKVTSYDRKIKQGREINQSSH
jgi:hypothetical protein